MLGITAKLVGKSVIKTGQGEYGVWRMEAR